jgi:hypothetical protein
MMTVRVAMLEVQDRQRGFGLGSINGNRRTRLRPWGAIRPRAWDDQRKEVFYVEGAETVEPGNQKAEAAEVGKEAGFDVAATRVGARSGEGSEKAVR